MPATGDLASGTSAGDLGDAAGDMGSSSSSDGPTVDSLSYASAPVGGVIAVNGSGFVAGDTVQLSGSTIATVMLTTLSQSSTAVAAFVPSVGTPPPADVLVRIVRPSGVYPQSGLPLHITAGKAYYLSPTGSDSAAGSYAAPWMTVTAAAAKMAPGDVAYLRGGSYSGQAQVSASGTAGAPLSFTAFPGEQPLLVEPPTQAGADLDTVRVLGAYVTLDHLRVTNQNNPGQAIWIGNDAHDVTIQNCEVFGGKAIGVLISGNNNLVYRNNIHDNGSHAPLDHGIYVEGGNNVIRSNTIHDNFAWGVQLFNGHGTTIGVGHNLVESNYIWGNGNGSNAVMPTGVVGGMVIGNGSNASTVRNNVLCGNAQYGIYLIDSEPQNTITGNVSCYNAQGGFYMRYPGAGNTLSGNISYNDGVFALSSTSGVASDNNYYFSSSGAPQLVWSGTSYTLAGFESASAQDAHSQILDAKFKNVPASGFTASAALGYNFCTPLNPALCKPLP